MYSMDKPSITDEEFNELMETWKQSAIEQLKAMYGDAFQYLPQDFVDKKVEELIPFKSKEEYIEAQTRTMENMKRYYKFVLWCSKKRAVVVCNPENPAQCIDAEKDCEFFEPRG